MKRLMKLSSVGLAMTLMVATVAQAQEEQPQREGAGRERGQQGQGDGQRRQRGGDQGQRGGFGGAPGGSGGGFGGGIDKLTLVAAKPVQEELKLGEDELFLINKLVEDQRAESRALFSGIDFRSLSEEDRRAKFEEAGKKRAELVKESEKGLAEFLTEAQAKRLDEIALQLKGIRALTDEDVAKKLKLSADQKKGVEDALKAADDDRRKMFEELRTAGGGFEGMREKMEEARKTSDAKALAILSADQKKQFDDMKGKPFEADRQAIFGFGGRGQGAPGGGRPGRGSGRPAGESGGRPQRPATE